MSAHEGREEKCPRAKTKCPLSFQTWSNPGTGARAFAPRHLGFHAGSAYSRVEQGIVTFTDEGGPKIDCIRVARLRANEGRSGRRSYGRRMHLSAVSALR